ncbi:MAG: hypothetical protein IJF97_02895 [Eggerthellaceae bacterium]|nr:hypothetical protein [Eggerthellaceae bacterium]
MIRLLSKTILSGVTKAVDGLTTKISRSPKQDTEGIEEEKQLEEAPVEKTAATTSPLASNKASISLPSKEEISGIDFRTIIKVNAIFIALSVIVILVGNLVNTDVGMLSEIVLFVAFVVVNAILIKKLPDDLIGKMIKADKNGSYEEEIARLSASYKRVLGRRRFFEKKTKNGSFYRAYELVDQQIAGDISSATELIKANQDKSYLLKYCEDAEEYADKLDQLVDHSILIDNQKDDIDNEFIDDFLASLEKLPR